MRVPQNRLLAPGFLVDQKVGEMPLKAFGIAASDIELLVRCAETIDRGPKVGPHRAAMQARVADKPVVIVLLDSGGKLTRVGDANRIKRWMESAHASRKAAIHAAANTSGGRGPG